MKDLIKRYLERYRKDRENKRRREVYDKADSLFQVCEHERELWITYDGHPVCPCAMLTKEPVTSICVMREMYISSKLKDREEE